MTRRLSNLCVALVLCCLACASTGLFGAGALRIDCDTRDAGIWIDDLYVGRAGEWGREPRFVRPGFHRVEVRHPGYYTHYAELDLKEGGDAVIEVNLRPLVE